jgi:hypothetical protein
MDLDEFLRKHAIAAVRHEHPAVMTVDADLERFLAATAHVPRVIDVPTAAER